VRTAFIAAGIAALFAAVALLGGVNEHHAAGIL
jgi:hypothetical protein